MKTQVVDRRLFWLLVVAACGLGLIALGACATVYTPSPTATPTRTPRPTDTPTPTPTPTPAWPVTVGCDSLVPAAACAELQAAVDQDAQHFTWSLNPALADVQLTAGGPDSSVPAGAWVYALAAPFYTLADEVSLADLQSTWSGAPAGALAGHPLLVSADALAACSALWGAPVTTTTTVVDPAALLGEAVRLDGWALLPFDQLEPRWKVLRIDGLSPLQKGLDLAAYPLILPLALTDDRRPDALQFLPAGLTNRSEEDMAVVVMTGVTAIARATARVMDTRGITFPAQDIGDWLRNADLTHTSNEVSFTPNCPPNQPEGTMTFCSQEAHIALLDEVGIDIVELTGNHNNDYGIEPNLHTLELFRQRGWQWFGGGTNLAEATRPLTVTLGPNRLAFLGCNDVGPEYAWATEDSPGAAPCDWEAMRARVSELRAAGWLPILTVQAYETYEYFPTPGQEEQFLSIAAAGAAVVQGSQAHQPQGFAFSNGAFVHYGLGNLFFDQMWSLGTRQELIDRLVFYDGRLLSVELLTAMLEDYARPRPMTAEERVELLQATFAVSEWGE